jgi:3D (Asp-Asp-Asp) domain-containing protein
MKRKIAGFLLFACLVTGCRFNADSDEQTKKETPEQKSPSQNNTPSNTPTNTPTETPTNTNDPNSPVATGNPPPANPGNVPIQVTPGNNYILFWGDILGPEGVIKNGQMLINSSGTIVYIGTDASILPEAAGATVINAPGGLAAPGMIDCSRHQNYWAEPKSVVRADKYDQRHDWRKGTRNHVRLTVLSVSSYIEDQVQGIFDGVTSTVMAGQNSSNFQRNLCSINTETGGKLVEYETFPLGDSGGYQTTMPATYNPNISENTLRTRSTSTFLEIAMGIDAEARTEYVSITPQYNNFLVPGVSLVGGAGLQTRDFQEMAKSGIGLVWIPVSDLKLYGDTARITVFKSLGGKIALGSYWNATGSLSVQRELRAAYEYNKTYLNSFFSTKELYEMVTKNAAEITGFGDNLGSLQRGFIADFVVYDKNGYEGYDVPIMSDPEHIAMVFKNGRLMLGNAVFTANIPEANSGSDDVTVGTTLKRLYLTKETGISWSSILQRNLYPVQTTGPSVSEVTIHPERPLTAQATYDGISVADDYDGDGITNQIDLAPRVFNPARAIDTYSQQDSDGDGIADEADPYPLMKESNSVLLPIAPANLVQRDPDSYPITLFWDPVTDAQVYQVFRSSVSDGSFSRLVYSGNASTCTDSFAESDSRYFYRVRAYNDAGFGQYSSVLSVVIPDCTISEVFNPDPSAIPFGSNVSIKSVYVTAVFAKGFYFQDLSGSDFSAGYAFTQQAPNVAVGNKIDLKGTKTDYFGKIELTSPSFTITDTQTNLPVIPEVVAVSDIQNSTYSPYLYGLIQISGQSWASDIQDATDKCVFVLSSGLYVNSQIFSFVSPSQSTNWNSISGILDVDTKAHKAICPRDSEDFRLQN